jgi:MtrB/PioB family decaheme-associated outer membrane protein
MNARLGAKTLIAAAIAAIGNPALADERAELKTPDSSVSAGIGFVSDDNTRFGQYNGMVEKGPYLLLDADVVKREDATGTWTRLRGRNLGLESRNLRFDQSRQGDWGYFIEYDQIPRYSPYTPLTRLTGEDTTRQTVNGLSVPRELEMKTERRRIDLGLDKIVSRGVDVQVRFRNEDKSGRRLFGRTGTDFLVDPIDYTTQIVEATAGFTGERLQLSGGYYGSNFVNGKTKIDVVGGTGAGFSPIALPPGNQAHQFHLSGGYGFTPSTRGTFKLAYNHQTQHDQFIDVSTSGRTNLGGVVNTSLIQAGFNSRPMRGLSLIGNVRREDKHDATPVVDYFNVTTASTATGENEPRSIRTTAGKLEAGYELAWQVRAIAGVDYEQKRRNTSSVRVVSHREKTEETAWRAELRRAIGETLTGSIGYVAANRSGTPWENTVQSTGANGSNLVHPLHLADRSRDKLRTTAGWNPVEPFDMQFVGEISKDKYSGRTLGLEDGSAAFVSLDSTYRITENWQTTLWLSRDDTRANMRSCESAAGANTGNISACPNTPADPIWTAHLRNVGNAAGLGVKGRVQAPPPPGDTPVPDVNFNRTTLRLTGNYTMSKQSGVRVQYIQDRFSTNDWTWDTWTYSDGTRVLPNANQRVSFVGLSGYYNF